MNMSEPEAWVAGIGSRQTPDPMLRVIHLLGRDLAARRIGIRSGNARGADQAWEAGASAAGGRVVSFLAAAGQGRSGIPFDTLHPLVQERAMEIASTLHPAWDRMTSYVRKLMARNVCQVLGSGLDHPVEGVLCWAEGTKFKDNAIADVAGGTGLAVRLAHARGIPVLNLALRGHYEHARRWHHDPASPLKSLLDLPSPQTC